MARVERLDFGGCILITLKPDPTIAARAAKEARRATLRAAYRAAQERRTPPAPAEWAGPSLSDFAP
jgi:hypothetical protein